MPQSCVVNSGIKRTRPVSQLTSNASFNRQRHCGTILVPTCELFSDSSKGVATMTVSRRAPNAATEFKKRISARLCPSIAHGGLRHVSSTSRRMTSFT
eukprot:scaffold146025_cov38-Tisochrysis_lutea.AAC.1